MKPIVLLIAALALLAGQTAAHPGGHAEDHSSLRNYVRSAQASLSACSGAEHIEALERKSLQRRSAWLDNINHARGMRRRDLATVLATSHKSNLTGVTTSTAASVLFNNTVTCILEPKVTEGPYWVSGEAVRTDLRESQGGVDLYVDIEFIDISTCQPVTGFYVDFWHANSTGVYSGVVASGNGNSADTTNSKKNFHRGIYPVGSDGVVQFITKFPGHYTGRTNHIHVMAAKTGTLYANNTYLVSGATHIGQIFFDETLTAQVEAVSPYSTNKQTRTTNAQDSIMSSSTANNFDPVVNYVLLGDSVSSGVFSWIRIGIDTTKTYSANSAARYSGSSSTGSSSPTPSPSSAASSASPSPSTGAVVATPTPTPSAAAASPSPSSSGSSSSTPSKSAASPVFGSPSLLVSIVIAALTVAASW